MHFADINNNTIHFGQVGNPAAHTLVFVNSLGTDFRIWRDVAADLLADYQIILYDKRGHGLSGAPEGPYTIDDHIEDFIGLADHLELERMVICGVSVGGMIAQGAAARIPERIQGLVLCDTAHVIGPKDMWDTRMAAIKEEGLDAIGDSVMERWFSPEFHQFNVQQLAGYRNMFSRTPLAGYLGTCSAIRDADFTETSANISLPTLCVCGEHDGATPPDLVQSLAALIPGADFEMITSAGHLPSVEQPEVLTKLIRNFLVANNIN